MTPAAKLRPCARRFTSESLRSLSSDVGLIVPGHNRDVAGMKCKISRYPAHSRCQINANCFFSSSFYLCVSLGSSFEANFFHRDITRAEGENSQGPGSPWEKSSFKESH